MNELVLQYDCPLLDLGDRKGYWGYIDFIAERELGKTAAVKGVDCIGRAFLSLKAEFLFENGDSLPTFATFFQKYVNNKNIWQCFNYIGMELLKTSYEGDGYPVDAKQIALLQQLLTQNKVDELDLALLPSFTVPPNSLQMRADRISSYY
jgi:hypothetical protein